MRKSTDLLARYAEYHRDRRNIATHFIGIPMIVFAAGVLLARPVVAVDGWPLTLAWLAFALSALWWLTRGNLAVGVVTSAGTAVLMLAAHRVAAGSTAAWLAWGVGFFVVGWLVQFVGHYYEGRKPAFVDDVTGLLVGPMFVAAEAMFAAGWNHALLREIERRVGPPMVRDLAMPQAAR